MNYAQEETFKILLSAIGDLWRFPIWWYTDGLKLMVDYCLGRMKDVGERLAIGLFLKYFFKPMYGDYSWSGRIISLVMRLVLVFYKLVRLIGWALWCVFIFILWLVVLPVSIILIIW